MKTGFKRICRWILGVATMLTPLAVLANGVGKIP